MKLLLLPALLLSLPGLSQTVRYVNRERAPLLVMPSATSTRLVGTVEGGSQAKVLNTQPSGWAYISVLGAKGWMPKSDLVSTTDSVTAKDADWDMIRKHPGYGIVTLEGEKPPVALTPAALVAITKRGTALPQRKKHK